MGPIRCHVGPGLSLLLLAGAKRPLLPPHPQSTAGCCGSGLSAQLHIYGNQASVCRDGRSCEGRAGGFNGWKGGGRGDAHPLVSTVSLKPGLCAGGGRRCQRPSSKELRVMEGEEVQCSCGKAKRTGAFLWIPCVRVVSEVGSSVAAGRGGGVASPCAQIGGWGRSGSQRMTRYSSNSTRMDTRRPILLCSQPRKRHKHQQILGSATVMAAAAACQLEFVDKRWKSGRTVGCEGSH